MGKIERMSIAEAKEQAAEWEECQRSYSIANRFRTSSASEVIEMWQSQNNKKGAEAYAVRIRGAD